MKKTLRSCSRYLLLTLLPLMSVGCKESSPSAQADASSTSAATSGYAYKVNPALPDQLKKRTPELLIVNEQAQCLHYSTGYSPGFFGEALETLFNQVQNPVGPPLITDEIRADFIERHPNEVAQLKESVKNLPDEVRENSFNKVIDDAIAQEINAQQSRKPFAYCDQHLDEHLSWIVDAKGQPVTRDQVLVPRIVTVLQYRNDDCDDCFAQQREIDEYIANRHLFVNYIFVERKPQNP